MVARLFLQQSCIVVGTPMREKTGNLKAVMRMMGHRDARTSTKYQHRELEIIRAALDRGNKGDEASALKKSTAHFTRVTGGLAVNYARRSDLRG
jgi:hypothetical protein